MLNLDFTLEQLTTVPDGIDPDRSESLVRFALEQQSASGDWTFAVALVSDDHLQQLHRDFMGVDEPTDVMTFPMSMSGDEQGGDVAISVDHARERSEEWGNSPVEEIEFLMVHGLLHLLGWHDDDNAQRAAMLQRQAEILQAFEEAHSARSV